MIKGLQQKQTKPKNFTLSRSVELDERRVLKRVSFAQNTASLLRVQAAVGMSEPGGYSGDFHAVLHTK